jgi:hypothetical protein
MIRSNPPLQVVGFIGTRASDAERGPLAVVNAAEAQTRLIHEGEVVWLSGPRRQELVPVAIDESVPRGGIVLRDVLGATVSEIVRLEKLPTPPAPSQASEPVGE